MRWGGHTWLSSHTLSRARAKGSDPFGHEGWVYSVEILVYEHRE